MKVRLVTTWQIPCGIAEHSSMLVEAVQAADPTIQHEPITNLHPSAILNDPTPFDLLVLNYQASLHSQWQPDTIRQVRARGVPVLCIYHDTGVPNSDQCKAIINAADAAVVHEPFDDLPVEKTHYWRMGVPGWEPPYQYDRSRSSWCGPRPILGTVGFPFPWKNYDKLAEVTAAAGWALLLIAPTATEAQILAWQRLNPSLRVIKEFTPRSSVVSYLAGCDATAFLYTCANTGQSGAVLQGIAARKPVIAFKTCRQFRALYEEYPVSIRWAGTFDDVALYLKTMPIERVDAWTTYIAERESWTRLGVKYASLYRSFVEGRT